MPTVLALTLALCLAACSGDPKTYGITGPGTTAAPVADDINKPDLAGAPGVTTTGSTYGPSLRPSTGNSGFWGYN